MVSSILSTCPSCQHHPCHDHSKCVQTLSNVPYRQKCSGWEAMSWGFGSERGRLILVLITAAVTLENFGSTVFSSPSLSTGLQYCQVLKWDCTRSNCWEVRARKQQPLLYFMQLRSLFLQDSPQASRFTTLDPWDPNRQRCYPRCSLHPLWAAEHPHRAQPMSPQPQRLQHQICRFLYITAKEGLEVLVCAEC